MPTCGVCVFLSGSPVVKEQLLPRFNIPLGVDTNPVFSIDHHHLGKTVGVDGVVSKTNLVPFTCGINDVICNPSNKV